MMPGMDGFEVCRRLKERPATRHIPVVLVTALDGRADRITGLEAGADEFLTKPIDDILLFARVKQPDAAEAGDRRAAPARGVRPAHRRHRRRGLAAGRRRRAHPDRRRPRAPGPAHLRRAGHRAPPGGRERPGEGAPDRARAGRPDHRQRHGARLRRPALRRPDPLRRGDAPPADPGRHRPRRPRPAGQGAGDRLQRRADRGRSTRRSCRRGCAARCAASATPTSCATTSTIRWSWRSPTS